MVPSLSPAVPSRSSTAAHHQLCWLCCSPSPPSLLSSPALHQQRGSLHQGLCSNGQRLVWRGTFGLTPVKETGRVIQENRACKWIHELKTLPKEEEGFGNEVRSKTRQEQIVAKPFLSLLKPEVDASWWPLFHTLASGQTYLPALLCNAITPLFNVLHFPLSLIWAEGQSSGCSQPFLNSALPAQEGAAPAQPSPCPHLTLIAAPSYARLSSELQNSPSCTAETSAVSQEKHCSITGRPQNLKILHWGPPALCRPRVPVGGTRLRRHEMRILTPQGYQIQKKNWFLITLTISSAFISPFFGFMVLGMKNMRIWRINWVNEGWLLMFRAQ